jgi:hypothetical protein
VLFDNTTMVKLLNIYSVDPLSHVIIFQVVISLRNVVLEIFAISLFLYITCTSIRELALVINSISAFSDNILVVEKKLHGLSPRANYTDRATAVCRRSNCQLLRIEGATWSA